MYMINIIIGMSQQTGSGVTTGRADEQAGNGLGV